MADTLLPITTRVERVEHRPAHDLNAFDRFITFFNPSYGVKALIARETLHQFGYNDDPRARGKAPPLRGAEAWNENRDRLKAMADARDAAKYDWIGGVISKIVLYVCGRIHCHTTTGDEGIDEVYDNYFHGWCGDEKDEETGRTRCDFSGRHRLVKMVQTAFRSFLVDGDHGMIEVEPIYDPATGQVMREFSLQNVEADRIGSPMDSTTEEFYIGGMTIDPETGSVVSFRIFRRTRAGQYVDPQDVPADGFIHIVDNERNDEYRGRTKLLPILNDLRDIRESLEAEKRAGKVQSQFAAFLTSKDPFKGTGATAWTGKTENGLPTMDVEYGKLVRMIEGDSVQMATPSARPSGSQMALWNLLIRKISTAFNLPYGFVWDLATLGGVTARIDVQFAQRQIQYWQDNIIAGLMLNRIRQKVIVQGVAQGVIPAHPNYKSCEWHFGPWIITDAGYEMDTDIAGMVHGVTPISEVCAKSGRTPREVFKSNASAANEAITVGSEAGLPVETFAGGLFPLITEQKAKMIEGAPPPPPPVAIETIGDKGVAKLLELIQSVKTGEIPHDEAVSTMVAVFGLTRRGAEKLCPPDPTPEEKAHEIAVAKASAGPKPATQAKRSSTAAKSAKSAKKSTSPSKKR